MSRAERLLAWIVTGPLGRLVAFILDLGAAWWRWGRRKASRSPQ